MAQGRVIRMTRFQDRRKKRTSVEQCLHLGMFLSGQTNTETLKRT